MYPPRLTHPLVLRLSDSRGRFPLPRDPETGTRYSVGSFLHTPELARHMPPRSFERLFGTQNGSEMGLPSESRHSWRRLCWGYWLRWEHSRTSVSGCEALPIVPALHCGLSRGISRCSDVLHQSDTCAPDSLTHSGGTYRKRSWRF